LPVIFLIMFDYNLGYQNLCSYGTQTQMQFIRDNIDSYPLFEKLLGFQREMNNLLTPIYEKKISYIPIPKNLNITDKMMTEMSITILCSFNIEHIFQAIRPLENNAIHVCANIIRPVYESIPKIFYLLRHPENISIIMAKEDFDLWESQQKYYDFQNNIKEVSKRKYLEKFLKTDGRAYFEGKNIEITDDFFKDFTHKFNNAWYRNQIYTNESLKLQNTTYGSLSLSSHADIIRSSMSREYDPVQSKQFMKILTDLSFFNLFLYTNASSEALNEINELADTIKFVHETQQELRHYFAMTHLYPDIPEYVNNLTIRPDLQNRTKQSSSNSTPDPPN